MKPIWKAGHVDGPNDDNIYTAAIDIDYNSCSDFVKWWGAAVEFHDRSYEGAASKRDFVLGLVWASGQADKPKELK